MCIIEYDEVPNLFSLSSYNKDRQQGQWHITKLPIHVTYRLKEDHRKKLVHQSTPQSSKDKIITNCSSKYLKQ